MLVLFTALALLKPTLDCEGCIGGAASDTETNGAMTLVVSADIMDGICAPQENGCKESPCRATISFTWTGMSPGQPVVLTELNSQFPGKIRFFSPEPIVDQDGSGSESLEGSISCTGAALSYAAACQGLVVQCGPVDCTHCPSTD